LGEVPLELPGPARRRQPAALQDLTQVGQLVAVAADAHIGDTLGDGSRDTLMDHGNSLDSSDVTERPVSDRGAGPRAKGPRSVAEPLDAVREAHRARRLPDDGAGGPPEDHEVTPGAPG